MSITYEMVSWNLELLYILLGYTNDIKGHCIRNPEAKNAIHTRHVMFDESTMFKRLQDLFDSPNLREKTKEMVIVPTYQPKSRVIIIGDKENAIDEKSNNILRSSSSNESDVMTLERIWFMVEPMVI